MTVYGRIFRYGSRLLAVGSIFGAATTSAIGAPTFTDVTVEAGVDYLQWDLPSSAAETLYLTGGAATADIDNDGLPDLYVTRIDAPDILFRNQGGGKFEDYTATAGLTANFASNGPAFADIDNDGDQDLYVTAIGGDRYYLYINDGMGHFTEDGVARNAAIRTTRSHKGFSTAFGDYDRDGYLDMYVSEWGNVGVSDSNPSHARLLRNLGSARPGYFEDTTNAAGVNIDDTVGFGPAATFGGVFAFTPTFADFNRDGYPDLAIAGDFHTSRLYWNNGDGTFTQSPGGPFGPEDLADPADPLPPGHSGIGTDENGMGSAIADFNGDGLLDWFVTSIYDPDDPCGDGISCNWDETGNRLYLNNGDQTFTDVTDSAGVRDGGWGWGATFLDYDNDGDLDLTMTNGVLFSNTHSVPFHTDQVRLWNNDGTGVFTEVAATEGVTDTASGKGILTFDYDVDGDLDLFVVNNGGHPKLYRNDSGDTNAYIDIDVQGDGTLTNKDGIGAFVTLIADEGGPEQTRYITGGNNYLSQSELTAHFGLGARTEPIFRITVAWPSGAITSFSNVAVNSTVIANEAPEPTTLIAIALGGLTLLHGRRQRRVVRAR